MPAVEDVTMRPFEERDFEPTAELVRTAWESGLDANLGRLAAHTILATYLTEHDWGLVAEREGTLLGVVLAGLRHPGDNARWHEALASLEDEAKAQDPELPSRLRELGEVEVAEAEVTRHLKENDLPEADATIQLLILSPEARGRHLGTRLFESALAWIRSQGARGYFLMTDDECDVGFYDHRGIPRLESVEIQHEGRPFGIYAYGERLL